MRLFRVEAAYKLLRAAVADFENIGGEGEAIHRAAGLAACADSAGSMRVLNGRGCLGMQ